MKFAATHIAALAAAALAGVTAAAEPAVSDPDWIEKPTGEQMGFAYPKLASTFGILGSATVTCQVAATGMLKDCVVASETPAGFGFGSAALTMTPYFRMSPKMEKGRPVAGGEVTIPIRFTLERDPPSGEIASKMGPRVDPALLQLAGKAVDSLGVLEMVEQIARTGVSGAAAAEYDSVPEGTREAAIKAYVRAVQIESPLIRDRLARRYAQLFTADELRQLIAFHESPVARKLKASRDEIGAEFAQALNAAGDRIGDEAAKQLCRQVECGPQVEMLFAPPAE